MAFFKKKATDKIKQEEVNEVEDTVSEDSIDISSDEFDFEDEKETDIENNTDTDDSLWDTDSEEQLSLDKEETNSDKEEINLDDFDFSIKEDSEPNESLEENTEEESKADDIDLSVIEDRDFILYLLCDRRNNKLLKYFRDCGVDASFLYYKVEELKEAIQFEMSDIKIVIMETGTGRFLSPNIRSDIMDILGIASAGAGNKVSVFYTDAALKSSAEYSREIDEKKIKWLRYRSTADVVANLLQNRKDHYILVEDCEKVQEINTDEVLDSLPPARDLVNTMSEEKKPLLSMDDVIKHSIDIDPSDELEAFKITKI